MRPKVSKILVPGHQDESVFSAGCRDENVVNERPRSFRERHPVLAKKCGKYPATFLECPNRWRCEPSAAFKNPDNAALQRVRLPVGDRSRAQLLHDNGAHVSDRRVALQKTIKLPFHHRIPDGVEIDVRIENVFSAHAGSGFIDVVEAAYGSHAANPGSQFLSKCNRVQRSIDRLSFRFDAELPTGEIELSLVDAKVFTDPTPPGTAAGLRVYCG